MNKNIVFLAVLAISLAAVSSFKLMRQNELVNPSGTWTTFDNFPASSNSASDSGTKSFQNRTEPQANNSSSSSATSTARQANTSGTDNENAKLASRLIRADTAASRIEILDKDSDFTFNFLNPPQGSIVARGKVGYLIRATPSNFPALIGNGISMNVAFLGPCGLNTPHLHPRASELNYVVNGTLDVGFIAENGARPVLNKVSGGTVVVFPQGSIHWLANLECESVLTIASFNDEDAGFTQIAQNFFKIDEEVLSATLGGVSTEFVDQTAAIIPKNIALGLQSCLKKCALVSQGNTKTNCKGDNHSGC